MGSDNWAASTTALAGKPAKKPKKELDEVRTKKAKSGGVIHTHHFTHPEHHAPEQHISSNDQELVQHMMQNMSTGNAGPASSPDGDDSGAAPQAAGPAQAPPPAIPGT